MMRARDTTMSRDMVVSRALKESSVRYACFCKEQADNKQYAIEKFTEQIEVLVVEIVQKLLTQSHRCPSSP